MNIPTLPCLKAAFGVSKVNKYRALDINMLSYMDPVSLLISKVRSADSANILELMTYEMKKMAAARKKDGSSYRTEVWKKLYLQMKGAEVNPMDFLKATAELDPVLKRMGYQGLLRSRCTDYLVLMPNTLSRDLEAKTYADEALTFLCNIHDKHQVLAGIAFKAETSEDDENLYSKAIIAKSKYTDALPFAIASSKEIHLLVKLQVVLDRGTPQTMEDGDAEFLKSAVFDVKSSFTKLKILQALRKMVVEGTVLNERLIRLLKDVIAIPFRRHIDIGLAIEAARLLMLSRDLCGNAEDLVSRLVNSENVNCQHLGFKLVSEYKIIPDAAIARIIELGMLRKVHVDALMELVDSSNYKTIYKRIRGLVNSIPCASCYRGSLDQVIYRLCDFGDQEFICKVLYENPKVYSYVKKKNLLIKEQSKRLFDRILYQENSDYFPMVYDLFPTRSRHHYGASALCLRHLNILINEQRKESIMKVDYLLDFMCINGNITSNRQMILDAFELFITKMNASLIEKLISGVLLFNIILPTKLLHIRDAIFIEYAVEEKLIKIQYPTSVEGAWVTGAIIVKEEEIDGKIAKSYEMESRREMVIVVIDQGIQYKKHVYTNLS